MHLGHARFDRAQQIEVVVAGQVGVDPALDAHFGRAPVPRFLRARGDLVVGQEVRVGIVAPLRECAEAASHVTDVREVDVSVDDVRDDVADGVAPHVVGDPAHLLEGVSLGLEQRERFVVGEDRTTIGARERRVYVTAVSRGPRRPRARDIDLERIPIPVDDVGVGA